MYFSIVFTVIAILVLSWRIMLHKMVPRKDEYLWDTEDGFMLLMKLYGWNSFIRGFWIFIPVALLYVLLIWLFVL
jgi:hypothetical protein